MEFHQTVRGAKFFDRDIPSLIKQLSRIADSLEKKQEHSAPTPLVGRRASCIRLSFDEYQALVSRLFPDDGITVEYALDGLWYESSSGNDFTDEDFFEPLAEQLGVSRVLSIHADDSEPIRVWIEYKEVD